MSRNERRCVKAVRDAADALLAARNPAETYMARLAFIRSLEALDKWATETATR